MIRIILSVIIIAGFHMVVKSDPKNPKYNEYANARRYCVKRDTTTIPGYIITTWHRNGRPDWKMPSVVTNKLYSIVGRKQNNSIENERDLAKMQAKVANKIRGFVKKIKEKDDKNLNKVIKVIEKARDISSDEMYDLYQSILDLLNEE